MYQKIKSSVEKYGCAPIPLGSWSQKAGECSHNFLRFLDSYPSEYKRTLTIPSSGVLRSGYSSEGEGGKHPAIEWFYYDPSVLEVLKYDVRDNSPLADFLSSAEVVFRGALESFKENVLAPVKGQHPGFNDKLLLIPGNIKLKLVCYRNASGEFLREPSIHRGSMSMYLRGSGRGLEIGRTRNEMRDVQDHFKELGLGIGSDLGIFFPGETCEGDVGSSVFSPAWYAVRSSPAHDPRFHRWAMVLRVESTDALIQLPIPTHSQEARSGVSAAA